MGLVRLIEATPPERSRSPPQKQNAKKEKTKQFNNNIRWVECGFCKKWRKIPTGMQFVKFTCQMSKWDLERRTCDAQEEDYDNKIKSSDEDDEIVKRVTKRVLEKKVPSQKVKKAATKRAPAPKKKRMKLNDDNLNNDEGDIDREQPLNPLNKILVLTLKGLRYG